MQPAHIHKLPALAYLSLDHHYSEIHVDMSAGARLQLAEERPGGQGGLLHAQSPSHREQERLDRAKPATVKPHLVTADKDAVFCSHEKTTDHDE
jgi:hypothetical protein